MSTTHQTGKKLDRAVIVLLAIGLTFFAFDKFVLDPSRDAAMIENATRDAVESLKELTPEKSIAVLPFVNMSADSENEYFSDGLSEELLNLLAKIPELHVAARTSAFSFKGSDADISEIASKLHVAHVLEGSVRKSGDDIRITAQLIKASDGYHLWSESWDRKLTDVFSIQDEIAAAVVGALKVTLLGEAPHARVTDARAYELYLQSKALANLSTKESFEEAVLLFNDALAIDPNYVEAWAELGSVQINQVGRGYVPATIGIERARNSLGRALQIEADSTPALSGLGWIAVFYEWDFPKAARLLQEARTLEPGNVDVLNTTAALVSAFGQVHEKVNLLEAALERDPLAMSVLHNLTIGYLNTGRLDDAARRIEDMRAVAPNGFLVTMDEAWLSWFRGDANDALGKFTELGGPMGHWGRLFALHDLGRDEEINEALQQLVDSGARPSQFAAVYAYLGDHDRAFEAYDRAYESRDDWLIEIREFIFLESLHRDPRWEALLKKIGISDADAERIDI